MGPIASATDADWDLTMNVNLGRFSDSRRMSDFG
jgi:hypothetical protein